VSTGVGQGAGEGEWGAGTAVGGSPGRERRCGGRTRERRREERGEVWSALGVLGVAFIGLREGAGGVAGVTVAMNGY
jgi:hypothetical protein